MAKSHGKHAKGNNKAKKAEKQEQASQEAAEEAASGAQDAALDSAADDAAADGAAAEEAADAADSAPAKGAHAASAVDANDGETQALPAEEAVPETDTVFGADAYSGSAYESEAAEGDEFAAVVPVGQTESNIEDELARRKRRRKAVKVLKIIGASIAGVVLLVYVGGIIYFSNWFFPGTSIGSIDASLKSSADVASELSQAVSKYKVTATGASGFSYSVDAEEAGLTIDANEITGQMHASLPAWQWPYLLTQSDHALTDLFVTQYSSAAALNADIKEKVAAFNETAEQPKNATIAYNETKKQFAVKAEELGTALDADAVAKAVDAALLSFQSEVALGEEELLKPAILSDNEKLKLAAEQATRMSAISISLTMAGNDVGTINADTISPWIKLDEEKIEVSLDTDAMNAYIDTLQGQLNTVGSERTYTRPDGKVITVSGGVYGWEVDGDTLRSSITEAVNSGSSQTIDIPTISQGAVYAESGKQDWGNRYIDIDLAEQHVRMYDENSNLIWESDCISGIPDGEHDTSVGVFTMNSKRSPNKLTGYENGRKIYESTVQYWMPFDADVIGLHDANWQPGFGGTMYRNGYGSHGCVNLPVSAAYNLYQICYEGDVVVSHW